MILPQWLFKEPFEIKNKEIHNPKSLKQSARDNIKLDEKTYKQRIS